MSLRSLNIGCVLIAKLGIGRTQFSFSYSSQVINDSSSLKEFRQLKCLTWMQYHSNLTPTSINLRLQSITTRSASSNIASSSINCTVNCFGLTLPSFISSNIMSARHILSLPPDIENFISNPVSKALIILILAASNTFILPSSAFITIFSHHTLDILHKVLVFLFLFLAPPL